ncbi:hypothetical protein O3M35_000627 [Rhynocoris fuscipes]|uniref:Uncharacterized protein n=1 Tax=Rhynocoris fuscipes TaxID=488301 RepID=A0AAW1DQ76_9HEMI
MEGKSQSLVQVNAEILDFVLPFHLIISNGYLSCNSRSTFCKQYSVSFVLVGPYFPPFKVFVHPVYCSGQSVGNSISPVGRCVQSRNFNLIR